MLLFDPFTYSEFMRIERIDNLIDSVLTFGPLIEEGEKNMIICKT